MHAARGQGDGGGEGYKRVATGRLYEGVAGLYSTLTFCLLNHATRNAVFDGATGIEEFELSVNFGLDSERLGDTIEAN